MKKEIEVVEHGGLALLAELEAAGALTRVGLQLNNPNLTYSTYEAIGALLGQTRRALQWAIGDYILHGEALFGESAYQAIEALDISEESRREYVRVALRVPHEIRRDDVPWSSHRAVASLPQPEQRKWLRKAADERLSHHDLREALRDGAAPEPSVCRCCKRPLS